MLACIRPLTTRLPSESFRVSRNSSITLQKLVRQARSSSFQRRKFLSSGAPDGNLLLFDYLAFERQNSSLIQANSPKTFT
jgi:hypothetical protein